MASASAVSGGQVTYFRLPSIPNFLLNEKWDNSRKTSSLLGNALKSIKYKGDVVIESFTTDVKVIARAAAIWRKMEPTREEIATKGLKYLKKVFK